jgi:hypothetical protein
MTGQLPIKRYSLVAISLAVLVVFMSACGYIEGPDSEIVHKTSTKPKLITPVDRLKQQAKERWWDFFSNPYPVDDEQASIVGEDQLFDNEVLNEGPPSKGLRIVLGGSAIQKGLYAAPNKVELNSYKDLSDNKILPSLGEWWNYANTGDDPPFTLTASVSKETDKWVGQLPDFPYASVCQYVVHMKPLKVGNGDVVVDVYPMDPAGSSSAHYVKKCTVQAKW